MLARCEKSRAGGTNFQRNVVCVRQLLQVQMPEKRAEEKSASVRITTQQHIAGADRVDANGSTTFYINGCAARKTTHSALFLVFALLLFVLPLLWRLSFWLVMFFPIKSCCN
mmetsp:Transcript_111320/g.315136  ORF Transcript_111320/g.315136 Transcript_111320/m.315136 type:complete len:112 (-) Transcript_111320:305-640(-)